MPRSADRMSATDTGRVPILERASGGLVGLVARRDLLRMRANMRRHEHEREALIRVLRRWSTGKIACGDFADISFVAGRQRRGATRSRSNQLSSRALRG